MQGFNGNGEKSVYDKRNEKVKESFQLFTVVYVRCSATISSVLCSYLQQHISMRDNTAGRHLFNGCRESKSKTEGVVCCGLPERKEGLAIVVSPQKLPQGHKSRNTLRYRVMQQTGPTSQNTSPFTANQQRLLLGVLCVLHSVKYCSFQRRRIKTKFN